MLSTKLRGMLAACLNRLEPYWLPVYRPTYSKRRSVDVYPVATNTGEISRKDVRNTDVTDTTADGNLIFKAPGVFTHVRKMSNYTA